MTDDWNIDNFDSNKKSELSTKKAEPKNDIDEFDLEIDFKSPAET